jgi:malate dehydrogenase (oxaloacetate-decarboxylating)
VNDSHAERSSPTDPHRPPTDKPYEDALRLHPFYRGKIETGLRCPVRDFNDFAIWYSPGVAAPCRTIASDPEKVYEYTSKWNTVAIVSDGSRVLGLGDIGAKAALPVMEGKALLFKYLGGVDAFPLTLDTRDAGRLIETVLLLQPPFGGVNLEDIAQPKCFEILDVLRERAEIPVWHDDQQGTATVILAGLLNALKVVGKRLDAVEIVFVGAGASNTAAARLIFARGADPARCRLVDSRGLLGPWRADIEAEQRRYAAKWRFCRLTNAEGRRGGIAEALQGADVVIAASQPGPGVIRPEWIRTMNNGAVVFACSNPVPEIWPWEATEAGAAVVATGRSDFPNQVNNSLCFPGLFRGALDARARTISDGMCFAAADAIADRVRHDLTSDRIVPTMDDEAVFAEEAAAVGLQAQREGLARVSWTREQYLENAHTLIRRARQMAAAAYRDGFVPPAPD